MVHCVLCSMLGDFQARLDDNVGNVGAHLCNDQVALEGPFIWCRPARCGNPLEQYETVMKVSDVELVWREYAVPSAEEADANYVNK